MSKIIIPAVGVLVVLGFWLWYSPGGSNQPQTTATGQENFSTSTDSTTISASPATTVASVPPVAATNQSASNTITNNQKIMNATLHTSMGDITIEFFPQNAPNTVANFIKLAQAGFYDGTKFHRVIKGFMDQGGDPLTKDDSKITQWGTGGPGYKFNDEISANNSNDAGAVAMANSGPNTQGSQFFINAVDNHNLDAGYTVFGHVTSGMDVVAAINNVPTDSADRPLSPVILQSVSLK